MAKKSDNRKQQGKQQKQQRASAQSKGAKGAITSKGRAGRPVKADASVRAQSAELRDAVEALRDAASALSQTAARSAAQGAPQPQMAQAPFGDMTMPGASGPFAPMQPQQPQQIQQFQTAQSGPDQEGLQPDQDQAVSQPNMASQQPAPFAPQPGQPLPPFPMPQMPPFGDPSQMPPFMPGPMPGPGPLPFPAPDAPQGDQDPVARVAHNASLGGDVGFMPKEPEKKRRWGSPIKSLRSAIASLTNRSAGSQPEPIMPAHMGMPQPVPNMGMPQPAPGMFQPGSVMTSPDSPMPPSVQIDYTPKPELLIDLPKFGEAPAVLPSPEELLASVPAISTTGQVMPTSVMSDLLPYSDDMLQSEQLSIPAMYGDAPSFSVELPADPIIEVPAQEVVYGEMQMPDPYPQTYGMPPYDPNTMYDPNAAFAYDPNVMQAFDPMQPQAFDPMQVQSFDPMHGQPFDPMQVQSFDPMQAQQMYDPMQPQQPQQPQFPPMQPQMPPQPQQPYEMPQDPMAMQGFDPNVHGSGFDQPPLDPQGYGHELIPDMPLLPMAQVKGGKATVSLILGILSILFAFVPPLGLILALVAFFLSKSYHKKGGTAPRAGTARVCAIVGIILSLLLAVAMAVFFAYFYGGLYGETNAGIIMGYLQTTPLKGFF